MKRVPLTWLVVDTVPGSDGDAYLLTVTRILIVSIVNLPR